MHKLNYRPDVDGLRALAVGAVVLFHIDPTWVPGGFVGVDVFFVISGFLISSGIAMEFAAGSFSYRDFYRRRIRRILPVLFVVIIVTLAAGQIILLPDDFRRLAYTAIASQLSIANIYFTYFLDTSYFADAANQEPLLHLWSLGVEEQFYIFWPFLFIFLLSLAGRAWILAAVGAAILASFYAAQHYVVSDPMFAYYMLPTRAGQLLTGAAAFLLLTSVARLPSWVRELGVLVGMMLILWSMAAISHETAYPGIAAIPVTLGSAMVLLAGDKSLKFSRALSWRPFVLVGLISYSLYLWHWPVLAYWRYIASDMSLLHQLIALMLMLTLSVISYRAIEVPFRSDDRPFGRVLTSKVVVPTGIVSVLCVLAISTGGYGAYAGDQNYRARVQILSAAQPASRSALVCQSPTLTEAMLANPNCQHGLDAAATVLLWGDSNAGHFVGFMTELADKIGFTFRNAAHSSCPPLLGTPEQFTRADRQEMCRSSGELVRSKLAAYRTIVLAGSWDSYEKYPGFEQSLGETIKSLVHSGHKVLVLGRVPRIASFDRECDAKRLKLQKLDCVSTAPAKKVNQINEQVKLISVGSGASYFDPASLMCDGDICSASHNGELVYFDGSHLTHEGSAAIGRDAMSNGASFSYLSSFFQY